MLEILAMLNSGKLSYKTFYEIRYLQQNHKEIFGNQQCAVASAGIHSKLSMKLKYGIVASSSPSCIEAHAGIFRLLMKGILDPYVL